MRRMSSVATALALGILQLTNGQAVSAPLAASALTASPLTTTDLESRGIAVPGTRLLWEGQAQRDADLDRIAAAGVGWLRFDVPWTQLEASPGVIDWSRVDAVVDGANRRNLKLLGIITTMAPWARPAGTNWQYGPVTEVERSRFANFAKAAASRYAGRISAWEVWNEPNLDQFWAPRPSATDYAKLLNVAYPALKAGDPSAVVISGGSGGAESTFDIDSVVWHNGLYAAGARPSFDAVAVHPYTDLNNVQSGEMARAAKIRSIMDTNGDWSKLMWGTETGAPTGGAKSVDENRAARLVAESDAAWRASPRHGPLFWYTIQDTSDPSREGHFGMLRLDGSAKPSYTMLQGLNASSNAPTQAPTASSSTVSVWLASDRSSTRASFTLRTTGSIRTKALLVAVRDKSGRNFDLWAATAPTLSGTQTFSPSRSTPLPAGTYTYWVAYQTTDSAWHDLGPSQSVVSTNVTRYRQTIGRSSTQFQPVITVQSV